MTQVAHTPYNYITRHNLPWWFGTFSKGGSTILWKWAVFACEIKAPACLPLFLSHCLLIVVRWVSGGLISRSHVFQINFHSTFSIKYYILCFFSSFFSNCNSFTDNGGIPNCFVIRSGIFNTKLFLSFEALWILCLEVFHQCQEIGGSI